MRNEDVFLTLFIIGTVTGIATKTKTFLWDPLDAVFEVFLTALVVTFGGYAACTFLPSELQSFVALVPLIYALVTLRSR